MRLPEENRYNEAQMNRLITDKLRSYSRDREGEAERREIKIKAGQGIKKRPRKNTDQE